MINRDFAGTVYFRRFVRVALVLAGISYSFSQGTEKDEFVVWSGQEGFKTPQIVVQFDPETGTGIDWAKAKNAPWHDSSDGALLGAAVEYFREGVEKMCGQRFEVVNSKELSRGVVVTTLKGADDSIQKDPAVQAALKNDGTDAYNDREAFFIRSEKERLLIVANTVEGLVCAVPELMKTVGYEILGMGPNWIHVLDQFQNRLSFTIEKAGRPGYYLRALSATSGQPYGVGTVMDSALLIDPADETVDISYKRWLVGRRMKTGSMPRFPGHALQGFHREVIDHIRKTGNTDGFLATVHLKPGAERPPIADQKGTTIWINSDPESHPDHGKVFVTGKGEWKEANLASLPANLDLSVPAVREIIFEKLKERSTAFFEKSPDQVFIFGTDPEDGGGYSDLGNLLKNPYWYPEYLNERGAKFGKPYSLHRFKGLDQPVEIWDADAPSDTVYGFNNWLLSEYDHWIDSLPESERITTTGQSKKEALRASFYCYNYHDVPPNFNPDPRIRVMIASYPKHRGRGKWKAFASQTDLAEAFSKMLPREPSGDYWIISLSYFSDRNLEGLSPRWDASPEFLTKRQQEHYASGFRALNAEMDFNFGRNGLGYYLLSELLWNPGLTAEELDAIRDRWLQRAYGAGWESMKAYYDFMLLKNYPVNSPHAWSRAIRLIEGADKLIDPATEPSAQRRLDDLKQYWYFYYLVDSGEDKSTSDAMRELFWKGQMSYMNASHMISRSIFNTSKAQEGAGKLVEDPAHFSAEETGVWWAKILEHWPVVPVTRFDEVTLADGTPGRDVDVNDLVAVTEFGDAPSRQGFLYNSGYMPAPKPLSVAGKAGAKIGFKLCWPADPTKKDGYYIARDVPWGVSRWNPKSQLWEEMADRTMTVQPSKEIEIPDSTRKGHHLAEIRFEAPQPGTYRFEFGKGGNLAFLNDLNWEPIGNTHSGGQSLTFDSNSTGLTQAPTFIYIPKGTKSLDLEVWDSYNAKFVTLYKTVPPGRAAISRKVEIGERKTHRIELALEETGTIAEISGNGFAFPYLYSVPMLWAKSPGQLLVPRAIAKADGLTIRASGE